MRLVLSASLLSDGSHPHSGWGRNTDAKRMKNIKLELTPAELTLLTSLVSDQMFRREFIDSKMPGYKPDPEQLQIGKALVGRLRSMSGQGGTRESASSTAIVSPRRTAPPKRAKTMSAV